MKIIVGLGNPGSRYARTRHNLGFMAVDAVARELGADVKKRVHQALTGHARYAGKNLLLVKPQTYMNLSGGSVAAMLEDNKAEPSDLVVVHDDLDLPLGSIRIRRAGGDGGHNGVASIIESIGTGSFVRIKVGVGRPPEGWDPADHVLSEFGPDELKTAGEAIARAVEAVISVLREGVDSAMNRFNSKPLD